MVFADTGNKKAVVLREAAAVQALHNPVDEPLAATGVERGAELQYAYRSRHRYPILIIMPGPIVGAGLGNSLNDYRVRDDDIFTPLVKAISS